MSTLSTTVPEPAADGPKIFRCGTLTYTQGQLYQLFFTLCWNEFTLMMLENVNAFSKNLQIEHHATYAQIGFFGFVSSVMGMWINPVFSVWSDRTRTSMGRRRPFLMACAPPLALCVLAVPFMPDLAHWLEQFPAASSLLRYAHMDSAVLTLGVCSVLLSIFNAMVLALFSYLYWDVVPQEVLGRWTAMGTVVTSAATVIWGFCLVKYAVHHMKFLCVSVSILCLLVYLLSVWLVKEGEYAKVDKHQTGGWIAPIRAYFLECYSDPFYLWIFGAFLMAGMANASNDYKGFYLRYDLHADYDVSGPITSIPYLIPVVLGYFVGNFADKLHPIRMYVPTYCFWGAVCFLSYFFVHNQRTFLIWSCITQAAIFANGVTYGALLPQIYPRAKFGQFCSANQLCSSIVVGMIAPIPVGILFDHLHNNRFAYLFSADFLFAGALMFMKVQRNFSKRHGHVPVPHAG
jgi:hypothetical protein